MGKQIHLSKIEKMFEKSPVVDFKSIERVVGTKKNSNYAKLLVSNLIKKGRIKKVGKGRYTKYSESSLAVFVFTPAYLGLQSSLSFHNLWEQETIPVILTTKQVRTGIRKIMDSNILIRKIDRKFFFGFEYVKEGNFYFPYSDIEKTFIDMIIFNQKIDEDVLRQLKKKLNKKRLAEYLKKYSKKKQKLVRDKLEN